MVSYSKPNRITLVYKCYFLAVILIVTLMIRCDSDKEYNENKKIISHVINITNSQNGIIPRQRTTQNYIKKELNITLSKKDGFDYIDIRHFLTPNETAFTTYIAADGTEVYACLNGGHVIYSDDEGATWRLIESIEQENFLGWKRSVYLACFTERKTVLIVGEFIYGERRFILVWRKAREMLSFSRTLAWETNRGRPACISVGKMGIFITLYGTLNILRSVDDGITWTLGRLPEGAVFKDHVHCVWAHPSQNRVYVSGGDAGPKYGEKPSMRWDGLGGVICSEDFRHWKIVYTEQPGERIVPITGNERRRYFGIELANSGALATYDDKNYEVIFGRQSLGFLNFNSLIFTPEGLLVAGTYQYQKITDSGYGHAGEIWISNDDGASFSRIRTAYSVISCIANSSQYIFIGFGYGGAGGQIDIGPHILRIPKKCFAFHFPKEKKVTKILMNKTDQTYGRDLPSGGVTHTVNMSPYSKIAIIVGVENSCKLVVEGHAYEYDSFYSRDFDRWVTVETLFFDKPGLKVQELKFPNNSFKIYRVRNVGKYSARIDQIAFIGILE